MMAFTKVATTEELPPGTAMSVLFNGIKVALFHLDDVYYAIGDICPHRGGPLSEGMILGTEVSCPWHAARFDLKSGAHLCPPAAKDVPAFKVQIVGNEIQLEPAQGP
jgi:nitrite reductase/ring-hydroxylating ferredoxin subunit